MVAGYQEISSPAPDLSSVVDLSEVRNGHIKLFHAMEDGILQHYVYAAVEHVQRLTKKTFVPHEFKMSLDCWPSDYVIRPEWSPIDKAEVTVEYYDTDGAIQTLDSSKYHIDDISTPGRIAIEEAPAIQAGVGRVLVTFKTKAAPIPTDLKQAIYMFTAGYYCDRLAGGKKASSFHSDARRYMTAAENICNMHGAYVSSYN